jgi:hypothetical protein
MLSALAWVPLGAAARVPRRQELSKAEVNAIEARSRGEVGGAGNDGAGGGGEGGGCRGRKRRRTRPVPRVP